MKKRATTLVVAFMLAWGVFALAQPSEAQSVAFANSIEQRKDMIRELRAIRGLLQQQVELLRTMAAEDAKKLKKAR